MRLNLRIVASVFPEARETSGKNGIEYNTDCPFPHSKGGRYKFYINRETGTYYCQDCGATGSAWEGFFDQMAGKYGHLQLVRDKPDPVRRGFWDSGKGIRWGKNKIMAPGKTEPLRSLPRDHPAYVYLRDERRMIESEFASETHPFAALYCSEGQVAVMGGECSSTGRIIYPVVFDGEIAGWTARKIERQISPELKITWDGKDWHEVGRVGKKWADHRIPKWMHLPSMPKSSMLYNWDEARKFDVLVLVEGPFDVHKTGLYAAGYFGERPSVHQVKLIKNSFSRVIWIPDRSVDLEGKAFRAVAGSLSEACQLTIAKLADYDDPGEAPRRAIRNHIQRILNETRSR
jgi:hypothetical protein